MYKYLLAKSVSPQELAQLRAEGDKEYLNKLKGAAKYTGHISLVMQAADILIAQLGGTMLRQLGLTHIDPIYFANTVRLAAWLHDWGKNSAHFQEMVFLKTLDPKSSDPKIREYRKQIQAKSKSHNDRQMLRHEIISGILALQVPAVRQWLEQCQNTNLMVAVWAAMGHHLKAGTNLEDKPAEFIAKIPDGTGDSMEIFTEHPDFKAVLRSGAQQFQQLGLSSELPEFPPELWTREQLEQALKGLYREFIEFESALTWEKQRFVAAVKATVIAADLAGSALPLVEEDFRQWMEEMLNLNLTTDELQQLLDLRLEGKPLRPFQQQIADSPHRVTLVKAGCGTGKTIGAYRWAQRHAEGKRLFFCYPTTGTASQGYLDYAEGTEIESVLMHSRADLDRELLFSREDDDVESIDARMQAFQTWRKKLIVCTVDSVLGLIQNNRKPLYAWAAISPGAFVFDEVHAYDDLLFGALLQFLRAFRGAPILLMSASFTNGQLQKIREVMAELGEEIADPIKGPQQLEELPRYQLRSIDTASPETSPEIWQAVIDTLKQGGKVLWVTNSVQTCIDLYRAAKTQLAQAGLEPPLIYHSRYRYFDRLDKHKQVIEAFRKKDTPVLAITTQVCEMSLDLSADLLVTAMAIVAAIIQRLGRLNRLVSELDGIYTLDSGRICTCIVYPWENHKPYEQKELETGKQFVERLQENPAISQQDLANVAIELGCHQPKHTTSAWLEGNWASYPDFLRSGGITITSLLQQDIDIIKLQAQQRQIKKNISFGQALMAEAQGYAVPIIPPKGWYEWKKIRFYPIAPPTAITYSPETGAEQCK
jgi:CRISPR-associated endonuclease/helicase Cas3